MTKDQYATGRKQDGWTGQRFSDMFIVEGQAKKGSKKKKGKEANANDDIVWGDMQPMSDVINTKDHEGVVTFDSRGKTMYFTKCLQVKNEKMGCAIYTTKKVGQDWANPEPVVIALDSGASIGHPALSADDNILYFAGELANGKGGKDIYMTTCMGFEGINEVRQGKYFEIDTNESDKKKAEEKVEEMCKKLLANLVIEDFKIIGSQ